DDYQLRRDRRPFAHPARRVLAGRTALAYGVPGGRHRRFTAGTLRAGGRGRARRSGAYAARDRRDEQRGGVTRRRAAAVGETFQHASWAAAARRGPAAWWRAPSRARRATA